MPGSAGSVATRRTQPQRSDRALAPSDAYTAEWASQLIAPDERHAWVTSGLLESQATVARQLAEQGIGPGDLDTNLGGRTMRQRLRDGESVGNVVARLRQILEES
jgi:hypothetical protein